MPVVCNLWAGGLPRQMTLAAPEAFPEADALHGLDFHLEVPRLFRPRPTVLSAPCHAWRRALFATTVSRSTVPAIVHSLVPETSNLELRARPSRG